MRLLLCLALSVAEFTSENGMLVFSLVLSLCSLLGLALTF